MIISALKSSNSAGPQSILRRFGVESTVRPSLAFYNTREEIDAMIAAIWNIKNARVTSMV